MTNSKMVEHTYRKHNTWLSQVAFNFTQNKDNAEELVQDLYLRLMEMKDISKIMYNNDINLFYLYKMIKSIYLNGLKKQTSTLPIDDDLINLSADEYSYEADDEFERTLELTNEALDEMHWFSSKLFRVYIEDNHSIQSLHDATGISNSTIWTSNKKTKQYIKDYVDKNKNR
jgi:DNA-directed RNA polymerase specialized sigma24 family protein